MRTKTATLLFVVSSFHSTPIHAAEPKWSDIHAEKEITITVNQQDGTPQELTIWFAVVDGRGYVRTWDSSWRAAVERDPNVSLRIAGRDYPVRVSAVEEKKLYDRVNRAYREKYGIMSDVLLVATRPFFGAWKIYRADSR